MSGLLRAGPSTCARRVVPCVQTVQKRSASHSKFKKNNSNNPNQVREKIPKDARIAVFRPMPAAKLTQPVFLPNDDFKLDLPPFEPTRTNVGTAARMGSPGEGPMRWFGVPKNVLLEFRLLSQPCSIIRDITATTAELLNKSQPYPSKSSRFVLTGRSGSGKSFLLLQAIDHCVANNWIVIYFPRAAQLVNSTTLHTYDIRTQTYLQPVYAFRTLQRLLSTNARLLAGITSQKAFTLDRREILPGTLLTDIIDLGLKEQSLAPIILDALLTELGAQTARPVLLAVDEFQALYTHRTAYRDPHFHYIKPYHLSMPRLLLEYASGRRSFARGAVIGALSTNPMFGTPAELADVLKTRQVDPYEEKDKSLVDYAKGLKALNVPEKLSVEEASTLFDLWMKDRALSAPPTDEVFLAKYTESSGNARDFVWKGILASLEGARPEDDPTLPTVPWPQLRLLE